MTSTASTEDVLHLVELTSKWRLLRSSFLACCLLYILARLDARSSAALAHRDQNHFARRETRPPILQTPAHRHAEEHLLEYVARRRTVYSADAFDAQSDPARLISAVLLHTDRPRSVALVLRSIVLHPFIKEVIVWNNGPADLDYATFAPMLAETNARLRIVNAPASLGDAARYHACTMARYPTCYFASDRWLNPYLDTLYTLYQDIDGDVSGTVIGAVPVDATWQAHRLRFSNPDLALHAGFALVETGSLASRDLARRFLAQQTVESMGLSRANALACDSYFGLWTNAYPIEIPGELLPVNLEGEPVETDDFDAAHQARMLDAIRKLYDVLRLINPRIVPSLFTTSLVQLDADVRAPCANDRCLFTTSLTPFDDTTTTAPPSRARTGTKAQNRAWALANAKKGRYSSPEDPDTIFDPSSIRSLADYTPSKDFPTLAWWRKKGSWHYAVDGTIPGVPRPPRPVTVPGAADRAAEKSLGTCWSSSRPPRTGDHVGLRLVPPRPQLRELVLIGSADLGHIVAGDDDDVEGESWEVWTMDDEGEQWEHRLPKRSALASPLPGAPAFLRITVDLQPSATDQPISRVKLVSRDGKREPLSLCGWELDGWSV